MANLLENEKNTLRFETAAPEKAENGVSFSFGRYSRRLTGNTFSALSTKVIDGLSGLIVSVILARYLLPAHMGSFFYIFAVAGFFCPVVDLGLGHICVREAVHNKSRQAALFGSMHLLRGLLFAGMIPFIVIVAVFCNWAPSELVSFVLCILTLSAVDQILLGPARAALLAFEKLHWDVLVAGAGLVFKVLALFVVIRFDWHLPGVFAGLLFAAILRAGIAITLVRCFCTRIRLVPDRKLLKLLFWLSLPLGLNVCVLAVRFPIGVILLKWFAGPEATSFFSLPMRIVGMVMLPTGAIATAAYPGLCRAAAKGHSVLHHGIRTLFTFLFFWNLAVFMVLYFPSMHITTLLFGKAFSPAGPLLALLAISPLLKTIDMLYGMTFIAIKRTHAYLAITLAATLVNIGAALVLIPVLSYAGAALAAIACDVTIVIVGSLVLSRYLGTSPLSGAVIAPGVSFLVGIVCALFVPGESWVACFAGLGVFAVVGIILMRKLGWGWLSLRVFEAADDGDPVK